MSSQLSDIATTNPKKAPIKIGDPINIDEEQLGGPVDAPGQEEEGPGDPEEEGTGDQEEEGEGDNEELMADSGVGLELGDIIDIVAPLNEVLNNNRFFIDFINEDKILLIDLKSFKKIQLNIDENGVIDNNSIANIALISRNEKKGYARQNNLLPGTWINIHFGGDVPAIITGEITNLEEDMIEITTFPGGRVIYIPFNYQGVPENLPIEQFEIRRKPEPRKEETDALLGEEEGKEGAEGEGKEETVGQDVDIDPADLYDPEDMDDTEEPDKTALQAKQQQAINKHILEDQIVFGEFNQPILQFVELDAKFKRYNIDVQTNDLLDSMMSTIPTNKQTPSVLNDIHTSIERFTQLRAEFSKFNKNGVIDRMTIKSHLHKPLREVLASSTSNLYWILPVAKNEKKMYSEDAAVVIVDNDIPDISRLQFYEDITNMTAIIEENKTMPISNDQNKYVELYNALNPFFTPFYNTNPNSQENANVLIQQLVTSDKSIIIDNYGDLHSSAMNANALSRKRFFMQRYNTGLTHLDVIAKTSTSMDTVVAPLTPADKMAITSYLTLPAPTIQFSKINLPGTNILVSSNLNTQFLNYWQLLKKNTRVNTIDVHLIDEEAPSVHSANVAKKRKEEQSLKNYFDSINHFVLKTRLGEEVANSGHFVNYLDKVIPTTKDIFNIMAKYIGGKVSLVNIVDALEPFLIYSGDLTYKQYQIIVSFIDCKISKFNKSMLEHKRAFNELKYINPKVIPPLRNTFINTSAALFPDSKVMYDMFYSYGYPDNTKRTSETEWLKKLITDDFGNVFNCSVALSTIYLKYPSHVSELLEFTNEHLKQDRIKDVAEDKCVNYTIAKKYRVKTEIDADNGIEIYYDKEFDKTPYGLLDDYVNERNKLNQDDFEKFLVDKLQKKHKFGEQLSQEHAVSMIIGMKPVKEGDYAVFFNSVQNAFEFYVRETNLWRLDENASKDMFQGSPDTLCNIQKDCLYSAQQVNGVCESLTVNKDNLQVNAMNSIMDQFDQKYETSKQEQTAKLLGQFNYYVAIIAKLKEMHKYNKFKQTIANYELGLTLVNDTETVVSPYSPFLDIILGQDDLAKKYENILNFSRLCTRAPVERTENTHFRYCIKTNTPLLPQFLYTLAMAFINNHEHYADVLQDVIRIHGVISEEGDRIVDKHCGKLIALANFSEEEGFDAAGFQVRTREVEEADWADMQPEEPSAGPLINVAMSAETQLIYKIVNALSSATGISIPAQMEFIVRNVKNTVMTVLPTEDEVAERNEALEKKGKQPTSYEDQKNALFLYLTLGMFIIAVQTNVPSIKTRKSYPGCSSSFEGYPLEPGANKSFINYIACIAYKIRSNFAPWSVLLKKKEDYISSTIFNYIESYLAQTQEVIQKIKSKHEYMQSAEHGLLSSDIASIFSVKRMTTFLPSQIPVKMTHLAPVSHHFNQSLLDNLNTGSYKQTDQLNALQATIIRFSYAIQEEMQKVVTVVITKNVKKQHKLNLLINVGGKLALENTCCNEENGNSFLQYFKDKNADIGTFNDIVQRYSAILRDVKFYTTPCLFSSRINTKHMFPPLDVLFSSETIYKTFIHYCKFNSLKPIPTVLVPLCNDKPANFNKFDTIETQIGKLKNDNREYTNETMLRLLLIISSKNVINTTISQQAITRLQKIRAIIENVYVKYRADIIKTVPHAFQGHMMTVMDAYAEAQASTDDNDVINEMRDYLVNANKNLKKTILQFIKTHGQVSKGKLEKVQNSLHTIMEWGKSVGKNMQTDDIRSSINFIQTYLCNFIKIFPNAILSQNSLNTFQKVIPNHWNISPNDASKISMEVTEYYSKLHHFYGNSRLTNVLQRVPVDLNVILELANDTPIGDGVNAFDKKTGLYLFEFYFLTTLHGYINSINLKPVAAQAMRAGLDMDTPFDGAPLAAEDVEYDEYSSEINQGELKDIKHHVAGLLMSYLDLMEGHKIMVNISYDFIMNSVFKIQQSEKDTFTSKLERMSPDVRKVDTLMKAHKIGDWNKGLQKGLTTYNKNLDDDELRAQNENYQRLERRMFANKDANPQNFEQYADDLLADAEMEDAIDNEEYGMGNIGDDFEDGNPYGEENNED